MSAAVRTRLRVACGMSWFLVMGILIVTTIPDTSMEYGVRLLYGPWGNGTNKLEHDL